MNVSINTISISHSFPKDLISVRAGCWCFRSRDARSLRATSKLPVGWVQGRLERRRKRARGRRSGRGISAVRQRGLTMKTSPGTLPVRIHRTFKLLGISVGATALLVAHSARAIETGEGDGGYHGWAGCPTQGWSSDPLSPNSIADHLTALFCLRHL